MEPAEFCWVGWLATATCHTEGIAAARDILLQAMVRFPREPAISYHLACYAVRNGDLEDAKDCLRRTFVLEKDLRQKALDDPELVPVWASIGQL